MTINAATSVTATFNSTPPPVTLTVAKSGTGAGTVSSAPAGIACGTDCSESVAPGTPFTLTATPAAGSTFIGWGGACSGTGSCPVTVSAATTVTATFTLTPVTLTVATSGTGSGTVGSTPSGISCGVDCTETVAHGTSLTLTATPAAGSTFIGWGGACSGTGSCPVTMSAATAVTATFNVDPRDSLGHEERHRHRYRVERAGRHQLRHRLQRVDRARCAASRSRPRRPPARPSPAGAAPAPAPAPAPSP